MATTPQVRRSQGRPHCLELSPEVLPGRRGDGLLQGVDLFDAERRRFVDGHRRIRVRDLGPGARMSHGTIRLRVTLEI